MSIEKDVHEDCNAGEYHPISDYNDIDDDGCLTSSSSDEDKLFCKDRTKKNERPDVYNLREDHATIKFKVTQRFKDAAECKLAVRKWAFLMDTTFARKIALAHN